MILGWTSTKAVQRMIICLKTWLLGAGQFSLYGFIENFEKLLLQNSWSNIKIISQKWSFSRPLPKRFKEFWYLKKTGVGPVFLIWLSIKLKKSSSPKLLVQFQNNFTAMILGWTSTKVVKIMIICQKTWPPGAGPFFLIHLYQKYYLHWFFCNCLIRWAI